MTQEELERIKLDNYAGITRLNDMRLLWTALEVAWAEQSKWSRRAYAAAKERDEAIKERDAAWIKICELETAMEGLLTEHGFLSTQNTEFLEDVSALTLERDSALMEGMALTQEKDGMQCQIDWLRIERDQARSRVEELERSEHICQKCELRKDSE